MQDKKETFSIAFTRSYQYQYQVGYMGPVQSGMQLCMIS